MFTSNKHSIEQYVWANINEVKESIIEPYVKKRPYQSAIKLPC